MQRRNNSSLSPPSMEEILSKQMDLKRWPEIDKTLSVLEVAQEKGLLQNKNTSEPRELLLPKHLSRVTHHLGLPMTTVFTGMLDLQCKDPDSSRETMIVGHSICRSFLLNRFHFSQNTDNLTF